MGWVTGARGRGLMWEGKSGRRAHIRLGEVGALKYMGGREWG